MFKKLAAAAATVTVTLLFSVPGCRKNSGDAPPVVPEPAGAPDTVADTSTAAAPDPPEAPPGLPAWLTDYRAISSDSARHEFMAEKLAVETDHLGSSIAAALGDPFPPIRRDAIAMVEQLPPDVAAPLLIRAAADADELLRHDALAGIQDLPEPHKLLALMDSLESPHTDIKLQIIPRLANTRKTAAFGAMILALDDAHPELLDAVNVQSKALLDKEFADSQSAATWWLENHQKFGENVHPLPAAPRPGH